MLKLNIRATLRTTSKHATGATPLSDRINPRPINRFNEMVDVPSYEQTLMQCRSILDPTLTPGCFSHTHTQYASWWFVKSLIGVSAQEPDRGKHPHVKFSFKYGTRIINNFTHSAAAKTSFDKKSDFSTWNVSKLVLLTLALASGWRGWQLDYSHFKVKANQHIILIYADFYIFRTDVFKANFIFSCVFHWFH